MTTWRYGNVSALLAPTVTYGSLYTKFQWGRALVVFNVSFLAKILANRLVAGDLRRHNVYKWRYL